MAIKSEFLLPTAGVQAKFDAMLADANRCKDNQRRAELIERVMAWGVAVNRRRSRPGRRKPGRLRTASRMQKRLLARLPTVEGVGQ